MYLPRRPTYFEMSHHLRYWLEGDDKHKWEDVSATNAVDSDAVAVFDNFCTSYPAYQGRVMVRLSGLNPYDVGVYVWADGKLMSASEYVARKQIR